ncbi:type 1 glutamine amidotransferase domain-containing protein [Nocardia iowensis]|uniref:Type 1 glutamine amidotransferase domain-containing protein n=1 Tax=Nocardia iowensis TaxID=204891 RepID=A0ABX8RZ53_NOCIO|nr:type 1 glutamine amidotransferase domain-containing protein [Nocardia iowensis]QXN94257.1 type 1 glutamine amidotransferase domain-containing protein [Nocardia iowensis]
MSTKRVLFFLTSHDDLGGIRKTGFYVHEAARPWKILTEAGYTVDLASVQGGVPPQDGRDPDDPGQEEFFADPRIAAQLADTKTPADYDPADYEAVVYVGGHGTMFDFPGNAALAEFSAKVYENGGVVAAVCHGPAGLLDIKLSEGDYLVSGKKLTSFTNEEEAAVGLTDVVPLLLETALTERGAIHQPAANFTDNVVVDGRLVTGQNPASANSFGEAIVKALANR